MRRIAATLAIISALVCGARAHAQTNAQDFPNHIIRLIVPYPPGGPSDVMGRLAAQAMTEALGQQVIVDNRPGGGSTLASRDVARAAPDGYTLLIGSAASTAIGPAIYKNIGYDPATSFAAVAFFSSTPYVMVTGPKTPFKSAQDVVAYAKVHPGKLNIGVPNGAPPHMIAAWFRARTATDIVIIPYKGAANLIPDMIAGQIELGFEPTSVTLAHLRDGSLRPLGVATAKRLPDLPEVPTLIESGVPDFIADSWIGIMAPAGTPAAIVDKLNAAINAGLQSPKLQARLNQLGAQWRIGTPQEFAAFIKDEDPKWVAMAKLSGLKAE
ncbi:MAG TPA: tripartite tricarboxylate transporter substrate binding protein [Xanthobacteraceae bacterium]|nr:tripartite tricarboxylate transporter substrate binding protein [Xanthobacteraceae bacterium]